jgi:hypothetical protein
MVEIVPRGIDNLSHVSCHVSCAIQMLCHAVPPIRLLLRCILEEHKNHCDNETEAADERRLTVPNTHNVFWNELLDFVGSQQQEAINNNNDINEDSTTQLPSWNPRRLYTYLKHCHGMDYEQVGDPSTTLMKLLHILRPSMGNLLEHSVWEGQTRQVLEGYKRLSEKEEEYLLRTKPGKIKAMSCPMVLRRPPSTSSMESGNACTSVPDLIKSVTDIPQVVSGTEYPWDSLAPDTFTEESVVMVDVDAIRRCCCCPTDAATTTTCNNNNNTWITTKRIEIHRIPCVWLLHIERPPPHDIMQQMQSPTTDASPMLYVKVPLELETTTTLHHVDNNSLPKLSLQGAILQVVEEVDSDDDNLQEDDVEVHSVVLLKSPQQQQQQQQWTLMDDDRCQVVSEDRAMKLLEGTIQEHRNDGQNSSSSSGKTYFGATLLVYSVPEEQQDDWKELTQSIQRQMLKIPLDSNAEEHLVGRRLKIKWAKDKFYAGVVIKYDAASGKHQVLYDDGDLREYVLSKKTVEWIDQSSSS